MLKSEYPEEDYLLLSGIQHFLFCRRQWALIHIEGRWADNRLTLEGDFLHERAHDAKLDGMAKGAFVSRAMPVCSRRLGLSGACDVVEFIPAEDGVPIAGRKGLFRPFPIEYKRGKRKLNDCDRAQLCAQAICLEEMLGIDIAQGAVYYAETRRRETVAFSEELRETVGRAVLEMHELTAKARTPRARPSKACGGCSLADECLPTLGRAQGVERYLAERLGDP